MKIALVSTCAVPVPPPAYGGVELIVATLAKALSGRGHDVYVYATGDSRPAGTLRSCFPKPVWPPNYACEVRHGDWAWADLCNLRVDAVHLHGPEALVGCNGSYRKPVVTIHNPRREHDVALYLSRACASFVAVSRRHAECFPELGTLPVIHHGLDETSYIAGPGDGEYCLFLGRIGPEKAPHLAIDAARSAGVPLILGAPHWRGNDYYDAYFKHAIAPRLAMPGAQWLGELAWAEKLHFLRHAKALLMPISPQEPFGLVMIEAMLVGTPVIAFARGSAPEIVEHGVTGLLVDDTDAMAAAIGVVHGIDRHACRARARERFTADRMAAEYEAIYCAA